MVTKFQDVQNNWLFLQSCRSLVFVGVHARRRDYKHHLQVLISGKLVTKKYFEDAMNHIKEKYRDEHVLFIMVSDDANWMKTMFSESQFEVVFSSTGHRFFINDLIVN